MFYSQSNTDNIANVACYRSHNRGHVWGYTMVYYLLFFSKQFEDVWALRLCVSGVLVFWKFGPVLA